MKNTLKEKAKQIHLASTTTNQPQINNKHIKNKEISENLSYKPKFSNSQNENFEEKDRIKSIIIQFYEKTRVKNKKSTSNINPYSEYINKIIYSMLVNKSKLNKTVSILNEINENLYNIINSQRMNNINEETKINNSEKEKIKKEIETSKKIENEIDEILNKANSVLKSGMSKKSIGNIGNIGNDCVVSNKKHEYNIKHDSNENDFKKRLVDKFKLIKSINYKRLSYLDNISIIKEKLTKYKKEYIDLKAKTYHLSKIFNEKIKKKPKIHMKNMEKTEKNEKSEGKSLFSLDYLTFITFPLFKHHSLHGIYNNYEINNKIKLEELLAIGFSISFFLNKQNHSITVNKPSDSLLNYNQTRRIHEKDEILNRFLVSLFSEMSKFTYEINKNIKPTGNFHVLSDVYRTSKAIALYYIIEVMKKNKKIFESKINQKENLLYISFMREVSSLLFNNGKFFFQVTKKS